MFNKKMIVKVEGMHCEHCKRSVEDGIKKIDNVKNVKADYNSGIVTVFYKDMVDVDSIKSVIDDLDFKFIEVKY